MTVACELCAKLFASEDEYKTHLSSKRHLAMMQKVCPVCEFKVGPPSHMAKHILTKGHQHILKMKQEGSILASDLYPKNIASGADYSFFTEQPSSNLTTIQSEQTPSTTLLTETHPTQLLTETQPEEVQSLTLTGVSSKKKFSTEVKLMPSEPEVEPVTTPSEAEPIVTPSEPIPVTFPSEAKSEVTPSEPKLKKHKTKKHKNVLDAKQDFLTPTPTTIAECVEDIETRRARRLSDIKARAFTICQKHQSVEAVENLNGDTIQDYKVILNDAMKIFKQEYKDKLIAENKYGYARDAIKKTMELLDLRAASILNRIPISK